MNLKTADCGKKMNQTDKIRERPILFSGPMVRAILEGRKTQTRRVVKPDPEYILDGENFPDGSVDCGYVWKFPKCPYGTPGDLLWVRETWCTSPAYYKWKPSDLPVGFPIWYRAEADDDESRWRPSIFMPRWASRITLEIVDVRVERLKDISEKDSRAEGIFETPRDPGFESWSTHGMRDYYATPRRAFKALWDSINAKRGYGWDTNHWVWVVEFRVM